MGQKDQLKVDRKYEIQEIIFQVSFIKIAITKVTVEKCTMNLKKYVLMMINLLCSEWKSTNSKISPGEIGCEVDSLPSAFALVGIWNLSNLLNINKSQKGWLFVQQYF